MSIDMAQFHQVFFEESFEGLDIMETGLLNMDPGAADAEEINSIFHAAHSIKGGSGTFGFMNVSDFTHVMETLLDEMRDGRREVTADAVDVLLQSVDVFQGLKKDGYILLNSGRGFDALGIGEFVSAFRQERICCLPATEIAVKHLGRPMPNAVLLGGFAAISGAITLESVHAAIRDKFGGKVADANVAAATDAFETVKSLIAQEASHA